MTKGEKIK